MCGQLRQDLLKSQSQNLLEEHLVRLKKKLKIPPELGAFKQDLLTSVKQTRRAEKARVTQVLVPQAAEVRSKDGLS